MPSCLLACLLVIALAAVPARCDTGPLSSWTFEEGSGTAIKDGVGQAHGAASGATFVRVGQGYALRFDGLDDHVAFGNPAVFSPANQITVEAWVYPEKPPVAGEAGIVGKGYENYVLTYYGDGHVWWYAGRSGTNAHAPVPAGAWHHVVGTYDGEKLNLYVDGELAATNDAMRGDIPAGLDFWMGKSQGSVQWTKNAHFAGMLDDVAVYGRALAAEEILQRYRTTHLTGVAAISAFPYYASREVMVSLDLRGLGEMPPGASATVELAPAASRRPLVSRTVPGLRTWGRPELSLSAPGLAPGEYEVRVRVLDGQGKALGEPAASRLTWPAPPKWTVRDPHVRIMNSLVTELRHERSLGGRTVLRFTNPREGWVFFRTVAEGAKGRVRLDVPSAGTLRTVIRQDCAAATTVEGMRRLPAGPHEATVTCIGGARVAELDIRSIPEIGYCRVDAGPQLAAYGPCDWPFLEKHVLPNINLAVSRGDPSERDHWRQWRRQGKRWIVETPLPGIGKTDGVSADEVEQQWIANGRVEETLLDGMIVDEFGGGDEPIWKSWHEGLKRLQANPSFAGKVFYPYCGPLFGSKGSQDFAQTVIDAGWAVGLERYLPEQRTESAARATIQATVINALQAWEEAQPGVTAHTLVVWGFMIGAPPESCNVDPGVDYKAFMDLQMHAIANDPAAFGLYGVTTYLSAYSDEETILWTSRLYRHYCIEGRTDRLTDYYRLPHLANPDFEQDLEGWTVSPAEAGTITTGTVPGLSWLEGRYPPTNQGNTYALTRRSAKGPNRLSQTLRQLQPGKLYSVKLISMDHGEWQAGVSKPQQHGLRLDVSGVEVIPAKTFHIAFPSCYAHSHGKFNINNRAYFNLMNVVFRADATEAQLSISDWLKTDEPGGPAGQELMFNFVEVQPYYDGINPPLHRVERGRG